MGLLDKTEHIHSNSTHSSLLEHASGLKKTADGAVTAKLYTTKKKRIDSFKEFIDCSLEMISDPALTKVGLLYASKDQFYPYILKDFDRTTLHKFRVGKDLLADKSCSISKQDLKDQISLREYLNDGSTEYYFLTSQNHTFSIITDNTNSLNLLSSKISLIEMLSSFLDKVSLQKDCTTMFNSYENIKPHLLTAELENLYINTFEFHLDILLSKLSVKPGIINDLFLLNIINNLLYDIFQRSAYTLKEQDLLRLYLLSMSKQNQLLLEHQVNRILNEFFFGEHHNILQLVKSEHLD